MSEPLHDPSIPPALNGGSYRSRLYVDAAVKIATLVAAGYLYARGGGELAYALLIGGYMYRPQRH